MRPRTTLLACLFPLLMACFAHARKQRHSPLPAAPKTGGTANAPAPSRDRKLDKQASRKAKPNKREMNRRERERARLAALHRAVVHAWHAPMRRRAPRNADGREHLVLELLNTAQTVTACPDSAQGGFSAYDLDLLSYHLRDWRRGNEFPIDGRLVDLLYAIQTHFRSEGLRAVSAYRTPTATGRSNHGLGRAIDIVVPGATDEQVAAFVRKRGFVGVGVYPTSGFVHVDVRTTGYSWVDRSGPGQRSAGHPILGQEMAAFDEQALREGVQRPTAWREPRPEVDLIWQQGSDTSEKESTGDQDTEPDDVEAWGAP